mgnify:CR=1 FL=1
MKLKKKMENVLLLALGLQVGTRERLPLYVCVCVFSRFLLKDDDFQLSTRPYFYSVEIMEQWTTRSAVVLFFVGGTLDSSGILKSSLLHGMTLFYPLVNKHSY